MKKQKVTEKELHHMVANDIDYSNVDVSDCDASGMSHGCDALPTEYKTYSFENRGLTT